MTIPGAAGFAFSGGTPENRIEQDFQEINSEWAANYQEIDSLLLASLIEAMKTFSTEHPEMFTGALSAAFGLRLQALGAIGGRMGLMELADAVRLGNEPSVASLEILNQMQNR